jgi:hypothetical protein
MSIRDTKYTSPQALREMYRKPKDAAREAVDPTSETRRRIEGVSSLAVSGALQERPVLTQRPVIVGNDAPDVMDDESKKRIPIN